MTPQDRGPSKEFIRLSMIFSLGAPLLVTITSLTVHVLPMGIEQVQNRYHYSMPCTMVTLYVFTQVYIC